MTDQLGGELTLWGEPEHVEPPPAELEKTPEEPVEPLTPAEPAEASESLAAAPAPPPPAEPSEAASEGAVPSEFADRVATEDAGMPGRQRADRPDRPAWPPLVAGEAALAQLEAAVAAPVHAYLLIGAPGNDKRAVARVFAAELLAAAGAPEGPEGVQQHRDRALRGVHPDVLMVEPEGRVLLAADAASIITEAARQPVEGTRKVIICDRFHTASQGVAASLLKTIEEPPTGTLIVLLADHLPPGHATVASRCVTIRLRTPSSEEVQDWLVATGGPPDLARRAARAAAGDLARARDLLTDDGLTRRFEAWWSVPDRLDGTGTQTAALVDELRGLIDAAEAAPAAAEADEPVDRTEDQRRRRQRRRVRDAELRFGFAVLAGRYCEALHPAAGGSPAASPPTGPPAVTAGQAGEAIDRLRAAAEALVRNPNEKLLLQDLLTHLATARP